MKAVSSRVGIAATVVLLAACNGGGQAHVYPDSMVVEVTGDEVEWLFRYPGPDGQLGTVDDAFSRQNLHLPANTRARLDLRSKDYIYTLMLPEWNTSEVAVPDMVFSMEIHTTAQGQFEFLGDQFCGFSHDSLLGKVIVHSWPDFEKWVDSATPPG